MNVSAWRTRRAWAWKAFAVAAVLAFLVALGLGAAYFWAHANPPHATPEDVMLFQGVRYIREVTAMPRHMVSHVVYVDLDTPDLRFLVTPPDYEGERMLRARTVSEFASEYGVQIAINANYFRPFRPGFVVGGYPKSGQPVDVVGVAASDGEVYSWRPWRPGMVFICEEQRVSFTRPQRYYTVLSGNGFLFRDGAPRPIEDTRPYPRAALGLTEDASRLILVVVDGRQRGYSEGATLHELAAILWRHGARTAVRLDEGGSATLVAQGPDGRPRVLNRPIHARIPGRERPVANHLGVYARPLQHTPATPGAS